MADNPRLSKNFRAFLGVLFLLILIGAGLYVINDQRAELLGIGNVLSHLDYDYLVLALVVEIGSLAAYSQLLRSLLFTGGVGSGLWKMITIFLASYSINNLLPGGPAFASVYSYRRFRDLGASEGLAGWALFASNVLAAMALLFLALIGLVVSEGNASGISLVGSIAMVGLFLVLALLAVAKAGHVIAIFGFLFSQIHKKFGFSWAGTQKIRELQREVSTISPSPVRLISGFSWGFANWVLDAGALVFAYLATGSPVPFGGILLAYSAGQLAANFPITPGGLGVVEGSISIALVAYGGNQEATVAAVLLYRFLSFWIWLLPGLVSYVGLRLAKNKRRDRLSLTQLDFVQKEAEDA